MAKLKKKGGEKMPVDVDFLPADPNETNTPILLAKDSTYFIWDSKKGLLYRVISRHDQTTIELCLAFAIQNINGCFKVDVLDKPPPEPLATLTAENPEFVTHIFGEPKGKVIITHYQQSKPEP